MAIAGGERVADGFGAVAGERGPVLDPGLDAVAVHAGQVQQHREPGRALDERADRGAVRADDQVAFPVARDGPVLGLGGSLADHHLRGDVTGLPAAAARARGTRSARPVRRQATSSR